MSIFSSNPVPKHKSNTFDLSHNRIQSMDAGPLYPSMIVELLPGSSIKTSAFPVVRMQPMLSPMYHKSAVYTFDFAVPIRILNESQEVFEKWWANTIPTLTSPVAPYFESVTGNPIVINIGDIGDYMGLPTQFVWDDISGSLIKQYDKIDLKLNAYIAAAYQKICTDHFRDENLGNIDPLTGEPEDYKYKLNQGWNDWRDYFILRHRAWQHDYFTSALPWVQKGPSVALPIADFDDVEVYTNQPNITTPPVYYWTDNSTSPTATGSGGDYLRVPGFPDDGTGKNPGALYADTSALSNSSLITVNALRYQLAIQHYLEANARGGTRYIELIKQHFHVESSDKRLHRAEFISASENSIVVSEVLQTSESLPTGTPQGNMAGHGASAAATRTSRYFAEEHTLFIRLTNIRPKTSYSQGIHRMWTRLTPLDYGDPLLANLGEQAIKNQEIFYTDLNGTFAPGDDWGYIPQFSEYKYKDDSYAGDFRGNLAFWHQGRMFNPTFPPKLNEAFIQCVPTKRIFAVNLPSNQPYLANIHHRVKVRHQLSKYGVPGIKTV